MFENGKNDHFSNEKTTETSTAPTIWNKGQIYETEIVPKMKELVSLCDKHEIPFLFNIIYERNTSTGDLGSGTIMHQQNKQGAGHLIPAAEIARGNLERGLILTSALLFNKKD